MLILSLHKLINRNNLVSKKRFFSLLLFFSEYLFKNINATIYIVENLEIIQINFIIWK